MYYPDPSPVTFWQNAWYIWDHHRGDPTPEKIYQERAAHSQNLRQTLLAQVGNALGRATQNGSSEFINVPRDAALGIINQRTIARFENRFNSTDSTEANTLSEIRKVMAELNPYFGFAIDGGNAAGMGLLDDKTYNRVVGSYDEYRGNPVWNGYPPLGFDFDFNVWTKDLKYARSPQMLIEILRSQFYKAFPEGDFTQFFINTKTGEITSVPDPADVIHAKPYVLAMRLKGVDISFALTPELVAEKAEAPEIKVRVDSPRLDRFGQNARVPNAFACSREIYFDSKQQIHVNPSSNSKLWEDTLHFTEDGKVVQIVGMAEELMPFMSMHSKKPDLIRKSGQELPLVVDPQLEQDHYHKPHPNKKTVLAMDNSSQLLVMEPGQVEKYGLNSFLNLTEIVELLTDVHSARTPDAIKLVLGRLEIAAGKWQKYADSSLTITNLIAALAVQTVDSFDGQNLSAQMQTVLEQYGFSKEDASRGVKYGLKWQREIGIYSRDLLRQGLLAGLPEWLAEKIFEWRGAWTYGSPWISLLAYSLAKLVTKDREVIDNIFWIGIAINTSACIGLACLRAHIDKLAEKNQLATHLIPSGNYSKGLYEELFPGQELILDRVFKLNMLLNRWNTKDEA